MLHLLQGRKENLSLKRLENLNTSKLQDSHKIVI